MLECPQPARLGRTQTTPTTENQNKRKSEPRSYPHTCIPRLLPHHTALLRRTALIDKEPYRLRVTIACLSETRFRGKPEIIEAHYTFYLPGVPGTDNNGQSNPRLKRPRFAIHNTTSLRIRRFTPVSSCIATIHLETGQANNLYIISVYAPTQAASGETLNEFYNYLTGAIDARPPDSDLIIAGDFNSLVGIRESEKSHPVGPIGIASANDRGLTLRTFCHIHNLLITNAHLPHWRFL